ncbi:hypothetical protein [Actinomadura sp. CNU-125]|uniref:hypothetical protein n=1 Tax=Actinomadura sp. CNU-125 TaxID=1904961 RepID=UPI003967161E
MSDAARSGRCRSGSCRSSACSTCSTTWTVPTSRTRSSAWRTSWRSPRRCSAPRRRSSSSPTWCSRSPAT